MDSAPTPGSQEAADAGCRCPRMDNGHGRGYLGGLLVNGAPMFVTREDCPLHGGYLPTPSSPPPPTAPGAQDA